jgi:hypothetical protein
MVTVQTIDDKNSQRWGSFISTSNNGTIFHQLDFLAYHQGRFYDNEHHLVWLKGQELVALMPMGVFTENGGLVAKSPFGASYGGIVTSRPPSYSLSRQLVTSLLEHLRQHGVSEIRMTFPIQACYRQYCATLEFCLLEQGFKLINSDISSLVLLDKADIENSIFTSRARNCVRKAKTHGLIAKFHEPAAVFWELMEKTFSRHGTKPTHSSEEWAWLCAHLPEDVWCDVAYLDEKALAGIGHMRINSRVDSSFYLCSDPAYQELQALSFLIGEAILKSQGEGFEAFDFGTSTANMVPRENIFLFKESFGAVGQFRKTYSFVF